MIWVRRSSASCSCPHSESFVAASSTRKSACPIIWWKSYRRPRARSIHSSASLNLPTAATVSSSAPSGRRCDGGGATAYSGVALTPSRAPLAVSAATLLDGATPRARLGAARLDELLEPLQVAFGLTAYEPELVACRLDHALGLHVELQH